MFCTNCGKEVAEGSIFCTSCGARMAETPVQQEASANIPNEVNTPGNPEAVNADNSHNNVTPSAPTGQVPDTKPEYAPPPAGSTHAIVPPKKSNTGIIIAVAGIALAVILILILSGGSKGGYDNYKDLVKDYYNAVYKEDLNAVIKMHEKDFQKDLNKDKKDVAEILEDMKSDWDDDYGKGWNKDIEVDDRISLGKGRYEIKVEIDGDPFESLYIIKIDGKYFIDEKESAFD